MGTAWARHAMYESAFRVTLLSVQPVDQAQRTYCLFQLFASVSTADSRPTHLLGSTLDSVTKGKPSDTLLYCILVTGFGHSSITTYLRRWYIREGQLKPYTWLTLARKVRVNTIRKVQTLNNV
jgi:hypothetical protein